MSEKPKKERAQFGYKAVGGYSGKLPNPFPRTMGPNTKKYLGEVADSGLTSNMTDRFEQAFSSAHGVRFCVSAPGCSNALMSLAEALRLNRGDEVIVSPITDYGTVMGIVKCGYIPVFADTAKDSCLITAETVKKCITDRTRAVFCVHKMGLMCDMDPIMALAKTHGLIVVEDCCQAVYSTYKGKKAGSIGDVGAYSFDSEKTMGSDIGGCFITDNEELYNYAAFFCMSRGAEMKPGYGRLHTVPGSAMRMPSCTAAINLAQFEILPENVAARDKMIRLIYSLLDTIPGITTEKPKDYQDVFSCWMAGFRVDLNAFDCTLPQFAKDCEDLGFTGIGTAYYYLIPEACTFLAENARAHSYPYCEPFNGGEYSYDISNYPNAVDYLSNFLRWSTFCEKYTEDDCHFICDVVKTVADKYRK